MMREEPTPPESEPAAASPSRHARAARAAPRVAGAPTRPGSGRVRRARSRGRPRLPARGRAAAGQGAPLQDLPDDALDADGPAYGRDEPAYGGATSRGGEPRPHAPVIRVVGVGGAGVNAINRMVEAGIPGVEFMAINTDLQSLQQSTADVTVHLGSGVARGLGAGSNPELGYKAAFEEQDKIKRLLKGSDMVFITAGAGGGTGTGAAPVIARLARDVGALTVGIVTQPFRFEGTRRGKQAEEGIEALERRGRHADRRPERAPAERARADTTMIEAFQVADDVLRQGVQGISELITLPGLINLDFADVRTTMRDAGHALLGIGMGTGDNRARARRRERRLLAPARDLGRRRALDPALDHRRLRPDPARGLRGGEGRPGGRPPRRQHHLRRQHRRVASTTRSG